jgi:hypothetical protein
MRLASRGHQGLIPYEVIFLDRNPESPDEVDTLMQLLYSLFLRRSLTIF